jgi:hypothetical protein
MKVDRGNPHVLCFIEHHMVKLNLGLIELENYSLGSSFSHVMLTIEMVFVFLLEKTCVMAVVISANSVKKKIKICAIQLTVKAKHLNIMCYIVLYLGVLVSS